jgi:molybdopterin converting factor small subunit
VESKLVEVRIDLFAGAGERAGSDHVMLELQTQPDLTQITAQSVLDCLGQACPSLSDLLPSCRLAVDCEYVSGETLVDVIQSEFALIPPVSGG